MLRASQGRRDMRVGLLPVRRREPVITDYLVRSGVEKVVVGSGAEVRQRYGLDGGGDNSFKATAVRRAALRGVVGGKSILLKGVTYGRPTKALQSEARVRN